MSIDVGDEVGYSADFLTSAFGWHSAGAVSRMRGRIESMEKFGSADLAVVKWSSGETSRVLVANLAKPGTLAFCEAKWRPRK